MHIIDMPTATMTDPPPLNIYLLQPILTHALLAPVLAARRHKTLDAPTWAAISPILTVFPPATAPDLYQVLFKRIPWIDTDTACKLGSLALLNLLHGRLRGHRPVQFTYPRALVLAAQGGHALVFDWWAANVGAIVLTDKARVAVVEAASKGGHAEIVARYAPRANESKLAQYAASVRAASAGGHVQVLNVWRELGYLDTAEVMDGSVLASAVVAGRVDVVQWWFQHSLLVGVAIPEMEVRTALGVAAMTGDRTGLDCMLGMFGERFDSRVAGLSCATGDLDWIRFCQAKAAGEQLSPEAGFAVALVLGHTHVLDWLLTLCSPTELANTSCASEWTLLEHAVPLLASDSHAPDGYQPLHRLIENGRGAGRVTPYTASCIGGNVDSLNWLHDHGIPLKLVLDQRLVEIAAGYGYVPVLEWIRMHVTHFIVSISPATLNKYMQWATDQGQVQVLDWWKLQSGHGFAPRDSAPIYFVQAVRMGHVQVLDWWQHSAPNTITFGFSEAVFAIEGGLESDLGVRWWIRHKDIDVRAMLRALSSNSYMALVDELLAQRGGAPPPDSIMCCASNTFPRAWDWLDWALNPANAHIVNGPAAAFGANTPGMHAIGNALFLDACWQAGWIQAPFSMFLPWVPDSNKGDDDDNDACVPVWEWAKAKGMRLRYKPDSLYEVSKLGKVHLLEWFVARLARFEVLAMPTSIQDLKRKCNPSGLTPLSACVARWWIEYGLPDVDPISARMQLLGL